jgi:serine/threonine protein kinase
MWLFVMYDAPGRRDTPVTWPSKAHDGARLDERRRPVVVTTHRDSRTGDLIGRKIGGYELVRLLGEGGMGSVYAAINRRLGKQLAVKVIARKFTTDPEIVCRLFREAKAVAALDDANIVEVYDLHEFEDGTTYISMKFIEGQPLSALMHNTRMLPIDAAIAIALQIASGLDAAHEQGIVHRDIKPDNILISRRWRRRFFVTILDFGIAKLLDAHLANNHNTRTAMVMGTLAYMSPEQARAERNIDARADIYSLGVLLYEMLTGQRPYDEETVYGLVEKQAQRTPFPRPRELRADIPQVIDELLLDMLQIDRHKRPGSMKEVGQELAKGTANGDLMLRTLAARLIVEQAPAQQANDVTLVGDVESSITRWTPARSMATSSRSRTLMGSLVGLALGAGGMALAMQHSFNSAAAPVVTTLREPDPPAATPSPAKSDANSATATASVPRSTPPVAAVAASGTSSDTSKAAASVPPAPDNKAATVATELVTKSVNQAPPVAAKPAKAEPSSKAEPSAAASTTTPAPAAPPVTNKSAAEVTVATKPAPTTATGKPAADVAMHPDGYLVIRVHTWADVSINGKSAGTAPLRVKLTAGRYDVRLANEAHDETVAVSVGGPKAETIIEKNW